jgi:hypothetical protein
MIGLRRRPRLKWPEFIGSYGLWVVALILAGLGILGLGQ